MERWDIDRYRRPALVPCEVAASGDDVLTIGVGDDAVDLSFEGVARDEVADVVAQLMRPSSDVWTKLNRGACPAWVRALTVQLDALSLIEETDSGIDSVTSGAERAIAMCAEVGQRLAAVVERRLAMYKNTLAIVHAMLADNDDERDATPGAFPFTGKPAGPFADNFALQALHFQLAYARRNAPELLIAWQRVLGEVFRHVCWFPAHATARSRCQKDAAPESFHSVASLDPVDLETYLLSFAHFVELAPLRVGRRMTCFASFDTARFDDACSGLTLAARAERLLINALDQLGSNAYASAALACNEITPLVKGLYIEQYHVTDRFVEILGPLLSRRVQRNLRARLFEYFQEEYGHEAFELATCVALGMNEADVRASVPLPLTALYIDAYTVLAHRMPTAFFASIMVTEGLRDQHSPVHAHIAALVENALHAGDIVAKHGETNDELNHPSLSRLFLADVPHVTAAEQRYSLEAALFMLEVNMRQLESVAYFYGGQTQLRFHGLHEGRRALEV
ncbi:iron-containing redox enzyme family protein [Paraburkholderia phymatum]|uniref:iron-containing redox enzyme family protein n=1 Tax=Paraburkholderia phymatum TaxID=148447 RepID=UPI00317B40E9